MNACAECSDHPEWAAEPEFLNNAGRVRNRAKLAALIENVMRQQPCRHWLERLDAADIPCGPINDYAQVFADPQVAARGMVARDRSSSARPAPNARIADQAECDAR